MHQWEWDQLPGGRTLVGRHVYFCIAKEVLLSGGFQTGQPLKQILFHPELTDRAIRSKLREFELEGYLEMVPGAADKRYRQLVPTQALIDAIHNHADAMRQAIEKKVYCIVKQP